MEDLQKSFATFIQCLQSSLAQEGGANHWQHCITDLQKTLKTLKGRSKELPDVFEIVLRPIWWVAGCEQPSPPLPPPRVGGVLSKSSAAAASLALHQDFCAPSKPYFPISVQIIFLIWTENWNNGIIVIHSTNTAHIYLLYLSKQWILFSHSKPDHFGHFYIRASVRAKNKWNY